MPNERDTENIIRDHLRSQAWAPGQDVRIHEQGDGDNIPKTIKDLLKNASKGTGKGRGRPEFIVEVADQPTLLLISECKPEVQQHGSGIALQQSSSQAVDETDEQAAARRTKYAEDGVLHYAEHLSKKYTVIAMAASGSKASDLKVTHFIWPKGASEPSMLTSRLGTPVASLVNWESYKQAANHNPEVRKLNKEQLLDFSKELHKFMHDHAGLSETEKPLVISGTILALMQPDFRSSYDKITNPRTLQRRWIEAIKTTLSTAGMRVRKEANLTQPYTTISESEELGEKHKKYKNGLLMKMIDDINDKVMPLMDAYSSLDLVGQFYAEFLRYSGSDQKLGIVLTPQHITELFAELANVTKDDKLLDTTCGTAGYLISGMTRMLRTAQGDLQIEKDIKENRLIGVEQKQHMFALAASNMTFRGDGTANLFLGSCFDFEPQLKELRCTVGMINPPYAKSDQDLSELSFVKLMLSCLVKGGLGLAIVPIGCALGNGSKAEQAIREQLMREHQLIGVMTMPDRLFGTKVGVNTCIMIWKAHTPHEAAGEPTWLATWKNDGFVINSKGRVDANGTWPAIMAEWVAMYRNRSEIANVSTRQQLKPTDEWLAEAWLPVDYSEITPAVYANVVRDHLLYRMRNQRPQGQAST